MRPMSLMVALAFSRCCSRSAMLKQAYHCSRLLAVFFILHSSFLTFGRACSRSGKLKLVWLSSLLIAAFILTSCSSEQVEPEVKQGTAIAFSANQQEEEVTRAGSTPLQNTGINSFRVWAIKNNGPQENPYSTYQMVMPEYRVRYAANSSGSSTTNSNSWDYILIAYPDQTPKYWDLEAKAYRFFAVTGETTITGLNPAEDGTYQSYRAAFNADATNPEMTPYYSKLWFSTGNTTDYPTREFGKPVQLEFMQPFAKIRFMVILSAPDIPLKLENGGRQGQRVDPTCCAQLRGTHDRAVRGCSQQRYPDLGFVQPAMDGE